MSRHRRAGGGLWAGVILIAVGTIFLLDRLDLISMGEVWQLWPLFVIWIGIMQLVRPDGGRRSIFLLLIGIWFQISTLELWGLDWGDSWPLVIVAVGASMVFDTLVNRGGRLTSSPPAAAATGPSAAGTDEPPVAEGAGAASMNGEESTDAT